MRTLSKYIILFSALLTAFSSGAATSESFTISKSRKGSETIVMRSDLLHADDTVAIFSPKRAKGDIPTLFLLHGRSGCWRDWNKHMDVQALADETGFRIICPDGFRRSWYFDGVAADAMQWRSFFWKELWPQLDARFHFNPEKTFITGLSMGGHGAMNIFLDHPDRFRGAGSMSGVLNLTHSGSAFKDCGPILGTSGSRDDALLLHNSAVTRLERVSEVCGADASKKLLLVCCGSSDKHFVPTAYEFADRCKALGLRYVLMVSPGAHKWPCWVWTVRYQLDWFNQVLEGGALGAGK